MGNKQGQHVDNQHSSLSNPPGTDRPRPFSSNSNPPDNRNAIDGDLSNDIDKRSKIPKDLFMKFINCLREMPLEITEEQFQKLANLLQIVSSQKNEVILQKGENGKGIFLVVSGHCKVISDNDMIVRIIGDEDYFGEISSFYKRPCSANVLAGEDNTKMLLLPSILLDDFMQRPVEYPLLDLFIARRYLDLENTSMKQSIITEIIKSAITMAPPFYNWSSEAINAMVKSILSKVVFYPVGADIFCYDDVDSNGHLLVQGSVELFNKNQESFQVLNAGPQGLWFGDEQLFCKTTRKTTAKAQTPCIVATISASHFQIITENFPLESSKLMNLSSKWKKMVEFENADVHNTWEFGLEMMRLLLRKSKLFEMAPSGLIYNVCLEIKCKKLNKDDKMFMGQDQYFIVLSGCIIVTSKDGVINTKYEESGILHPMEIKQNELEIRANEASVIGIFDEATLQEAQNMYPDAIINYKN